MNKDNSDIIDVLPAGEENDMSSSPHYTSISSLEEHSYCASIMSIGSSVAQEHVIGDLFGNSVELCNDIDTSIIRFPIEDVNLDGFNYSVPSIAANGNSESLELENMWVGLNSDTSTTTVVEVAATNDENVQQQSFDMMNIDKTDDGAAVSAAASTAASAVIRKVNQSRSFSSIVPKSKFRRTDFITDKKKRKIHFDLYFQRLTSDFHRVLSRTGCEGNLSASFEGKFYDGRNSSGAKNVTTSVEGSLLPRSTIVHTNNNESLTSDGMDDHRYAATMITQNIASSAVRDHQYDEKTVATAPDSDTTDNDEDSADPRRNRFKRENSKRYRYDYIKIRWERTQIFTKVVRSLFTSRKLLEQRTGAEIQLALEFEGIDFNEENYLNASKIISAHRKHLQSRRFNLAPKTLQTTTPTPLTFFLPNFNSFPFQVPYVIPVSSNPSVIPCGTLSNTDTGTTYNVTKNFDEIQPDQDNILDIGDYTPTLTLVESNNITSCVVNDEPNCKENNEHIHKVNSIHPCASASTSSSISTEDAQDLRDAALVYDNSSMQNSPEVTVARGVKESATNTEPICSICFNSSEESNNSFRANGENSTTKSFWIRCNDPFCYEMVHASCVGFVITHNIHLKQLPAYYCKSHR